MREGGVRGLSIRSGLGYTAAISGAVTASLLVLTAGAPAADREMRMEMEACVVASVQFKLLNHV